MRRHQKEYAQSVLGRVVIAAGLLLGGASTAASQTSRAMGILQTQYQVHIGEAVEIPVEPTTRDFILHAKTRRVTIDGQDVPGLAIAPNSANDTILLAPSVKAAPGQYTVMLSATSASGEEMRSQVALVVYPSVTVPKGATRNPVVLLNGWEYGFAGSNNCPVATNSLTDFGNLAQYLVQDGVPVVYLFDNCAQDANQPIETLAADLSIFLNSIKYTDGTQVPQIDLVAHGMGGLIVRAYLEGLQGNQTYLPPYNPLVGKLVLIATPNFGSFVAGNLYQAFQTGSQSAEQVPGSSFLWNLATWNQRGDDLAGVNAIAVAGNAGLYSTTASTTGLTSESDGLVSTTSASLGFVINPVNTNHTRLVPYCHVNPSAFLNTALGTFNCNAAGIAYITDTQHPTGVIVRSFLGGTTTWQTTGTSPSADTFLPTNGGAFFAMQNATASYVGDISAVNWGTVAMTDGGNLLTIYYTDFVTGTGDFVATSKSLGKVDCGSLAIVAGSFTAYRCKLNLAITCPPGSSTSCSGAVTPLSTTTTGRAVTAGTSITLTGVSFGTQCGNCRVYSTLAGSTAQALTVTSWSNTSITVKLPSTYTGYQTLQVNAVAGVDSIGVRAMAATTAPAIAVSPTSLSFAYTVGGATPVSQSFTVANSGSGTLTWTAAADSAWISLDTTTGSGGATVNVSIVPDSLTAAQTYTGKITISATGASNSPVTIPVTIVVAAPAAALTVSQTTFGFSYNAGDAAPAAQNLTVGSTGSGSFTWSASSAAYWATLSATSGSPGATVKVSVIPQNQAPGHYSTTFTLSASDPAVAPVQVTVTLVVQGSPPAPAITAVTNAGSYATTIAPATWIALFGTNLSQIATPYVWQNSDFVDGALPASVQGIAVTVNGIPAYIAYASPTQINVLAPDDSSIGSASTPVSVQLTVAGQSSTFSVQETRYSPAFLTFNNVYVAAQHLDFSLLGAPGFEAGGPFTPAAPGEQIILYGVGFGPTSPATPTGQLVTAANPLPAAANLQIAIGGQPATVQFAGLSSSGLYQFNVTVPSNLPAGDAILTASIAGYPAQTGVKITIGQ